MLSFPFQLPWEHFETINTTINLCLFYLIFHYLIKTEMVRFPRGSLIFAMPTSLITTNSGNNDANHDTNNNASNDNNAMVPCNEPNEDGRRSQSSNHSGSKNAATVSLMSSPTMSSPTNAGLVCPSNDKITAKVEPSPCQFSG